MVRHRQIQIRRELKRELKEFLEAKVGQKLHLRTDTPSGEVPI